MRSPHLEVSDVDPELRVVVHNVLGGREVRRGHGEEKGTW